MKRVVVALTAAASPLLCVPNAATAAPLAVVTSTPDLAAIAHAVGGDRITVESIAGGGQDPHYLSARPSYMIRTRRADLWIRVGMGLEAGWEELLIQGSRNPRIRPGQPGHLDASSGILPLDIPATGTDRSAGDVHAAGNPHYWLDPLNGIHVAHTIGERLARLDPAGSDYYRARVRAFADTIESALNGADGWQARLAPFRGARVLTFHRSWSYFLKRFGLVSVGELEPKPGIRPGPGHLADVIDTATQQDVRLILIEPFYDRKGADLVASRTGAVVVQIANTVGGDDGIRTYPQLIDRIVGAVQNALATDQAHD